MTLTKQEVGKMDTKIYPEFKIVETDHRITSFLVWNSWSFNVMLWPQSHRIVYRRCTCSRQRIMGYSKALWGRCSVIDHMHKMADKQQILQLFCSLKYLVTFTHLITSILGSYLRRIWKGRSMYLQFCILNMYLALEIKCQGHCVEVVTYNSDLFWNHM